MVRWQFWEPVKTVEPTSLRHLRARRQSFFLRVLTVGMISKWLLLFKPTFWLNASCSSSLRIVLNNYRISLLVRLFAINIANRMGDLRPTRGALRCFNVHRIVDRASNACKLVSKKERTVFSTLSMRVQGYLVLYLYRFRAYFAYT